MLNYITMPQMISFILQNKKEFSKLKEIRALKLRKGQNQFDAHTV